MTNQEALTKVVLHARAQGERALDSCDQCVYRTASGRRCFLGCLLTEEEANKATEACTVTEDVIEYLGLEQSFAGALMWIHDRSSPESWERELGKEATKWGLSMPAADTAG